MSAHRLGGAMRGMLGIAAGWWLISCVSDSGPGSGAGGERGPAFNAHPVIGDFVLYAERSVSLGDHDFVIDGDVGVAALAMQSFGPQLVVGAVSVVDPVHNLIAPSVLLSLGASVGDVETAALQNNGAHLLSVTGLPSTMPPIPIVLPSTPGSGSVTVDRDDCSVLGPGAYGALVVDGTLRLRPGEFSFANVTLGDHASLLADGGAVDVRVAGRLSTGQHATIAPIDCRDEHCDGGDSDDAQSQGAGGDDHGDGGGRGQGQGNGGQEGGKKGKGMGGGAHERVGRVGEGDGDRGNNWGGGEHEEACEDTCNDDGHGEHGFSSPASQLTISVAGLDGTSGPPAVSIGAHTFVHALVAAPRGSLSVQGYADVRGALAAFDISLGDHSQVTFDSGFSPNAAGQHGQQVLSGYITAAISAAPIVGPLPFDAVMPLAISIPLRDQAGLQAFVDSVSNPMNPMYRQYKTIDALTTDYGPTLADNNKLVAFAQSAGLTVTSTPAGRFLVVAQGAVGAVEQAFHVNLNLYLRPDGTRFYALDQEPSLDFALPLLHVSGLESYQRSVPAMGSGPPVSGTCLSLNGGLPPTGPCCIDGNCLWTYAGNDFRNAYLGSSGSCSGLTGTGQAIGVFSFDTFQTGDLQAYASAAHISANAIQNVNKIEPMGNLWSGSDISGQLEASADVEILMSMAPGALIDFFDWPEGCLGGVFGCNPPGDVFGNPGGSAETDAELGQIMGFAPGCTQVNQGTAFGPCPALPGGLPITQLTSSWMAATDFTIPIDLFYMSGAGVSIFQAAGDNGAWPVNTGTPSDIRHDIATNWGGMLVGGTVLSMGGPPPGGFWNGEGAWGGGGGGVFGDIQIPSWQGPALVGAPPPVSLTSRNTPDVSANAVGFLINVASQTYENSGTSGASPLWAGFTALVNQKASLSGVGPAGYLNPVIYGIAGLLPRSTSSLYDATFHDPQSPGGNGYNATSGYDLATGLGTPSCNLLTVLASPSPLSQPGTVVPPTLVPISTSVSYGCAIIGGSIQCWGSGLLGQTGGAPGVGDVAGCVGGALPLPPVFPVSVSAAQDHACALYSDSAVPPNTSLWCWGSNAFGELGTGDEVAHIGAVQVAGLTSVTAVAVGDDFSCALTGGGLVRCWGRNDLGQLGVGTGAPCMGLACSLTPVGPMLVDGVAGLAVGGSFACALLLDGSVQCWGDNEFGQLGGGSGAQPAFSTTPVTVAGVNSATAIAAGYSGYACATVAGGAVKCWGGDPNGELGNESTSGGSVAQPAPALSFGPLSFLALGLNHTCEIVLPDNHLYCFGDNVDEDCGSGTAQPELFPLYVPLPETPVAVATGGTAFTCALLTDGASPPNESVWCWGAGGAGQLGNGGLSDAIGNPVQVQLAHCP